MSRKSIHRRPLPTSPDHEPGEGEGLTPRRPDGVSLTHQASQQSIGSFRRQVSTDSTTVDVTSSSDHLMRPSAHEQDSLNEEIDTQPQRSHDTLYTTASGYAKLPTDSTISDVNLHKRQTDQSWRDKQLPHDGRKKRRSCMDHAEPWWFEISCCVFAVVLLAAISGILYYYESKPEKEFWGHASLNTIVAFVATLCRAVMVLPIAEGISQLKWNSFASGTRALKDLYTFDQASRGPFGSMMLLFKARGRLLGVSTLAALVMVSGLITSPMTQATIHYDYRPEKVVDSANVTRAISLDGYPAGVQDSMKRAALRSMFTDDYEPEPFRPKPLCPALKCSWDWFEALDICATTNNVTKELKYERSNYTEYDEHYGGDESAKVQPDEITNFTKISLEGINTWVRATSKTGPMLLSSRGPNNPEDLEASLAPWDHQGKIEDISEVFLGGIVFLSVPPHAPIFTRPVQISGLEATQVTWHWCVKNYTVTGNEGSLDVKSTLESRSPKRFEDFDTRLKPDNEECRVPAYSTDFIGEALSGGSGSKTGPSNEIRHERWRMFYPNIDLNNEETETAHLEKELNEFAKEDRSPTEVVKKMADSVAAAMGNVIRTIPENETTGLWKMEIRKARAVIGEPILFIRWPWLSLLATQVVFTILFLAYVIINTAIIDVEVVKSSNIGELLALNQLRDGVHRPDRPEEQGLPEGIRHELADESVLGRLRRYDGEWSLDLSQEKPSKKKGPNTFRRLLLRIFRL